MDTILFNIGWFLLFYVGMEWVAWFTHKYIMHGILWFLHADHHRKPPEQVLEKNDFFFVFFAIPGMALIFTGVNIGFAEPWLWMGLGITAYGATYFFVHDVFIHRRLPFMRNTKSTYFAAIRKAHKVHHKHLGKEHGECFGMLWAPRKYFREAKKAYGNK